MASARRNSDQDHQTARLTDGPEGKEGHPILQYSSPPTSHSSLYPVPSISRLPFESVAETVPQAWLADCFEFDKDARFILSSDQSVQFGNEKARELIAAGKLAVGGRKLRIGSPRSQEELDEILTATRRDLRQWRRKVVHLMDGDWATIRARMLDNPHRLIELVIKPTSSVVEVELRPVADAFGLTPIESRVLLGMARALCPKLIAKTCQVSVHTVRAHVRAIYAKLGTRSSAATQALILSLLD